MVRVAVCMIASWLLVACGATASGGQGGVLPADTHAADAANDAAADLVAGDAGDAAAADVAAEVATSDAAADSAEDAVSSMKDCTFNADCIAAERCECSETAGCFCKTGPRGTGKAGVDPCKDGQDCETSLCVEGPAYQTSYYCSGPCTTADDCGPKLPLCANIAFLGKVCIRDPNAKP
ncbi:MAG: hypothetical protein HY902_01760 [Deltaproteobacteria bacterium]|nr:hypothetical protein [Deltaproteobacteria bacterium]